MKLGTLLRTGIYPRKTALLIHKNQKTYQAQIVNYHPELLNLGVILAGYYYSPAKAVELFHLGNCISIGHYLAAPKILEYGRSFSKNPAFYQLPKKSRKHLVQGMYDGTIALYRDLSVSSPLLRSIHLHNLIHISPNVKEIYYFRMNHWLVIKNHHFLDLERAIQMVLFQEKEF